MLKKISNTLRNITPIIRSAHFVERFGVLIDTYKNIGQLLRPPLTDPSLKSNTEFWNKLMLKMSMLLGLSSLVSFALDRASYGSLWLGVGILLFILFLLPWFVVLRRRLGGATSLDEGRQMATVTKLLWISLLCVGMIGFIFFGAQLIEMKQGLAGLGLVIYTLLGVMIVLAISSIAFLVAFVIQIYRDQWRVKLTIV